MIPVKPVDDLFPPNFLAMNEFCRMLTIGGDVIMSRDTRPDGDPALIGKESVVVDHMDRDDAFEVTRIADDHFVIRRLKK